MAIFDAKGRKLFSRASTWPTVARCLFLRAWLITSSPTRFCSTCRMPRAKSPEFSIFLAAQPWWIPDRFSPATLPADCRHHAHGPLLDAAEIQHLADLTLMPVDAQTLSSAKLSPDFRAAAAAISEGSPHFIHPLDSQSLAAYQVLDDIYGRPAVIIRVLLPRTIYEQGDTSLLQFLLLLIAAGFVFGAATLYLLERFVISRIANLTENVTQIGASGDLAARLDVPVTTSSLSSASPSTACLKIWKNPRSNVTKAAHAWP